MSGDSSTILNKNVIFTFSKPVSKDDFINKIKESASNMVSFLKSNGCSQLGHIKFISTTNGEDYLQLSVLDIDQGPKIDGILKKTFEKIKLTLNVIVFGIQKDDMNKKVTEELTNLENYFHSN
jgi:hypothetical protein